MDAAAALITIRFALYVDLMLLFGVPLFALYTFRAGQRDVAVVLSARLLSVLALSGAVLSVAGFLLMASTISDVSIFRLDRIMLAALLDETAIGTAFKVRIAALLVALPVCWRAAWSRTSTAFVSGLGTVALGSLAWNGHGAANDGPGGWAHLIADIVHLLAAGVWVGALVGLLTLLLRARSGLPDRSARVALAHRALAGFSTVGVLAVGLIVLTGLVNSWFVIGVGNITSLAATPYGQLFVLKLLVFVGMIGLAGLNRRLTPAIVASSEADVAAAMRSIRRSVAVESGLALIVLGLVARLGTAAPPM